MTLTDSAKTGLLGPEAKAYHAGYVDGIGEMLNQLTGQSQNAPAGCYHGPVPDELQIWLAGVRKRLDNMKAENVRV